MYLMKSSRENSEDGIEENLDLKDSMESNDEFYGDKFSESRTEKKKELIRLTVEHENSAVNETNGIPYNKQDSSLWSVSILEFFRHTSQIYVFNFLLSILKKSQFITIQKRLSSSC